MVLLWWFDSYKTFFKKIGRIRNGSTCAECIGILVVGILFFCKMSNLTHIRMSRSAPTHRPMIHHLCRTPRKLFWVHRTNHRCSHHIGTHLPRNQSRCSMNNSPDHSPEKLPDPSLDSWESRTSPLGCVVAFWLRSVWKASVTCVPIPVCNDAGV